MIAIPFQTLRLIEQIARQVPLQGLVLILTKHSGKDVLGLYLDKYLPKVVSLPWHVKALSEFCDDDWLTFDGLASGYESLDLAFDFLQTHGPGFYDIRKLFWNLGAHEIEIQNSWELTRWLAEHSNPGPRMEEKLISLMLPAWVRRFPPEHQAVGLKLSLSNFPAYLDGSRVPRWWTIEDLSVLDNPDAWLLTFQEATSLFPTLPNWTEWRWLLRKGAHKSLYFDSLSSLARALWEKGKSQENLQNIAWELAVERWMPHWASIELLALCPWPDFDGFVDKGQAKLLFRSPLVSTRISKSVVSWGDFISRNFGPEESGGIWFALRPINERMQIILQQPSIKDLSLIWLRSGLWPSLAQALLGMAEDLREGDLGKNWLLPRAELSRLTLQGLYLAALSDPWDPAWKGAYHAILNNAYQLVDDVLLLAEQQGLENERPVFALLRCWHRMYGKEESLFVQDWNRLYESAVSIHSSSYPDVTSICHFVVEPRTALPNLPNQEFSDFLEHIFRRFRLISDKFVSFADKWQQFSQHVYQVTQAYERPGLQVVENELKKFRLLSRELYALPHEQAILQRFVGQDIQILERLRAALHGKAVLQVRLLTNPVIINHWTQFIVEIRNEGEIAVRGLQVELGSAVQDAIEVSDETIITLPLLAAHSDWRRLSWQARVRQDPGEIWLSCRFQEEREARDERFVLPVNILQPAGRGQGPRGGNRFEAGMPVWGDKFFGRHKELRNIFNLLLGDSHTPVILRGPRRIGKTSILRQIEHLLKNEGALQRLFGYNREEEAHIRRFRPVAVSLQSVRDKDDLPGWFFDLYRKMAEIAGKTVERLRRGDFRIDPDKTFADYLVHELLPNFPEIHWLILLDEWDESRHIAELGGKLRALMQSPAFPNLRWVFASTWMLGEEAGRYGSLFFNQCTAIELTEMAWEDAHHMVLSISREMGVEWEGAALLRLLEQTALRPYLIQRVGQSVIEHLQNLKPPSNLVDLETLDAVLSQIIRSHLDPTSPFAFLWPEGSSTARSAQEGRLSWLGRMILLALEDTNRPLTPTEVIGLLRDKFSRNGWLFPGQSLDEEIVEGNLTPMGKIFDVLKVINNTKQFTFSIPLAQAWFSQRLQEMEDPWQVAWEQLLQEYRLRSLPKETK